jgi:membrane fusion protein, multidrug efflux system
VMLVGADGKVSSQPIKTGSAQGDKWIVLQGLKAGDKVIVEGLQKVKPGATVKPMPWKNPASGAAANMAPNAAPQPAQKP